MKPLRIVFAGSPAAAVPSLSLLAESPHTVVGVITRTDSVQGRKRILTPTPVAEAASRLDIPVHRTNRLGEDAAHFVADLAPDLGVIVAYGGMVREPLLSAPRLGWINLHFSVLPQWRGAAPVQRSIMAGDDVVGASVFQLVDELDAGGVFGVLTESLPPHATAGETLEHLSHSGAQLLAEVVSGLALGTIEAAPQRGDVSYAPKMSLADGRLSLHAPAAAVYAQIRGTTPEPGAFVEVAGSKLKLLSARPSDREVPEGQLAEHEGSIYLGTMTQAIQLLQVHPAGKKPMSATDWWRGQRTNGTVTVE